MNNTISTRPDSRGNRIVLRLAACILTIFAPVLAVHAAGMDTCLMDALKYADDSTTVGQLREQCREEAETIARDAESSMEVTPADQNSTGPVEIILKTSGSRKPAFFPHKRHQDKYYCETCHHGQDASGRIVKYTENMAIEKCTVCHNANMPNEELNGFQLIGHKLCRECHRTHQDITSAKCSTCHHKDLK